MPLPFWAPYQAEASNDELCQKPVVVLTYNITKGFKMKQDMRYVGFSETESKYCTLQKRVQQESKKFIEEVQHQNTVLPSFVDTKDQSMASMLTGYSSKINLDWSTATFPIHSGILNQYVVTSPINLENPNRSAEKGYQNSPQSNMFDYEKGSESNTNNKHSKNWRITSK